VQIRYYMVCSRFEALIASHLEPEAFGTYMAVGTKKLASGHVAYFEIDPGFARLTDRFKVDDIEQRCVPHSDGTPKASKYISVYRVMEFLPLSVYGALYLTTPDGRVMKLDGAPYEDAAQPDGVHLYQELCPLVPLVVSTLPPGRFTKVLTDPKNPVSAPRIFFVDLRVDHDEHGKLAGWLPYSDRLHLEDCIHELESGGPELKATKTVSRTCLTQGFLHVIRRGFFLGDQTGVKFYRFPSRDDLEIHHSKWWHSAQAE
jgi:hypothetical protein